MNPHMQPCPVNVFDPLNPYNPLRDFAINDMIQYRSCGDVAQLLERTGIYYKLKNQGIPGKTDLSLLHTAVEKNRIDIVELLLDRGALIEDVDCNGATPLHYAAKIGSLKCVHTLLNYGANVNSVDHKGNTPLHYLIGASCVARMSMSETKFNWNVCRKNFFSQDIRPSSIISLKLAIGGEVYDDITEMAKEYRTRGVTNAVLEDLEAIEDVIETLVKFGADVNHRNQYGLTPLLKAMMFNACVKNIELLTKYGADVNEVNDRKRNALHLATKICGMDVIKVILKYIDDINAQDENGYTALFYAICKKNLDVIQLFLDKGADTRHLDSDNNTAINAAVKYGDMKTVQLFINRDGNINVKDFHMTSPIYNAAHAQKDDIVQLLIDNDAQFEYNFNDLCQLSMLIRCCNNFSTKTLFCTHMTKLTVLNKSRFKFSGCMLNTLLRNGLATDSEVEEFELEVNRMREKLVCSDLGVTYYDILTKNLTVVACYFDSCEFEEDVQKFSECGDEFPNYSYLLNIRLKRARVLHENCCSVSNIFKEYCELPWHIMYKIMGYITNSDRTLLYNVKPTSVSKNP